MNGFQENNILKKANAQLYDFSSTINRDNENPKFEYAKEYMKFEKWKAALTFLEYDQFYKWERSYKRFRKKYPKTELFIMCADMERVREMWEIFTIDDRFINFTEQIAHELLKLVNEQRLKILGELGT